MIDRFEPKMKPRLNVLHPEDIEEVYSATMEVLERTGVKVSHPRTLELLDGAGARVDDEGDLLGGDVAHGATIPRSRGGSDPDRSSQDVDLSAPAE